MKKSYLKKSMQPKYKDKCIVLYINKLLNSVKAHLIYVINFRSQKQFPKIRPGGLDRGQREPKGKNENLNHSPCHEKWAR